MSRPRIAIVAPAVHREGGTERSLAEHIERWRDRFDIVLYTMGAHDVDLSGVRLRTIREVPGPHLIRYLWWFGANQLARWWDAHRGQRSDIVYATGVNCFDAHAVSIHIVFEEFWRRAGQGAAPELLQSRRALRGVHRIVLWTLLRALERRVYEGPATIWAPSRREADLLERLFHRPRGTVTVVPHGVDCDVFSPSRRRALRDEARDRLGLGRERVLLLVGNDWHNKGVATALRALTSLPGEYHLAVAGRDAARPFTTLAANLNVAPRFRIWPHAPDVRPYYAAADCMLAPSREDAFHLPALEALASGLPAIVSREAGVSELLEDGCHALILRDPEDHETLARLIRRVFEEPGLTPSLSSEGRALAERCSWDASAERAAALIEREVTTPRVVLLAPDSWGTGGIERTSRNLLRALADLYGAERVGLISVWGETHRGCELPCRVLWSRPGRPAPGGASRVGLWRKLGATLAAVRVARRWRGPNTIIIATHVHLAPVAWLGHAVSGAPFGVWAHGMEAWGRTRRSVAFALRRARSVFAISRFTAKMLQTASDLPGNLCRVVPLGLRADWPAQDVPGVSRTRRVLTVARLTRAEAYKGVDTLLLSWPLVLAQVPDAELVVVGGGDDQARLQTIASKLGLDGRVRFLGRVDDRTLAEGYASASVFALPGRASLGPQPEGEGFGLVFLEAAVAGLPCVAGRAGGAVEAVEDGVTGLLVDPEQPRQVATALVRLLSDPNLAARMGEAGRQRVTREFSYERFRDRVGSLVNDLLHS